MQTINKETIEKQRSEQEEIFGALPVAAAVNLHEIHAPTGEPVAATVLIGAAIESSETTDAASFNAAARPRRFLKSLLQNRKAAFGVVIVAAFVLLAVFAPILAPNDPAAFVGRANQPPTLQHIFGTTGQGQDVFAQTLHGARTTLAVGFFAGFAVVLIGALVGMTAGYFGGWTDAFLSLLINIFLIVPSLPLAVVFAAYLPPGSMTIAFVLILTGWAWNARVLRAQTLVLREKDFVAAARCAGESDFRIIFWEILPNMISLVASCVIGATVFAIGAQVGLEYLGLGDAGGVTWGTNLFWASNNAALLLGAWWTVLPTGLSIALVGFALALINFAIDEATNPRLRSASNLSHESKKLFQNGQHITPIVRS